MKSSIAFLLVILALSGCAIGPDAKVTVTAPLWKSNAGKENKVDQATDADTSVPLPPLAP